MTVPVVGVGGALSKGDSVRAMLTSVAENVTGVVVPGCAHFVPEERPDVLHDLAVRARRPAPTTARTWPADTAPVHRSGQTC